MQSFAKFITTAAATIAVLYIGLFLFGWFAGRKLPFPMPDSSYATVDENWLKIPLSAAATSSATNAASAPATNEPVAAAEPFVVACIIEPEGDSKGYILYQHGNNEDLGTIQSRLRLLAEQGWTVLAWDYPGYGQSPGSASEASVSAAVRDVARYARDTLGWPVSETVIYGRSIGGGPSVLLATEDAYKGLILESTFTSAFRVATRIKVMPFDVFDNWARIGQIQSPVLFLHGTSDRVVPFSHGTHLLGSAPEPKSHSWFKGGGHNNLPEDYRQQYLEAVNTFLNSLEGNHGGQN